MTTNHDAEKSPFRSPAEREAERRTKRDALLRSAVRMFNERGFHATSLDDVAASLGVTKPMIYHYLGNKDQVLFECVQTGLSQLRLAAETAATQQGSGRSRLETALRRYGEITMEDFGRCVIRTSDDLLRPESRTEFRRLKAQIDRVIRDLIAAGISDGSIRPVNVKLTAFALAGAFSWCGRWYDPQGPLPPSEIAATMAETLIAGLWPNRASE